MLNDAVGKDFRVQWQRSDRPRPGRVGSRVLVVDSVIGSRLLLADAVTKAGFEAVTASNAIDARALIERDAIDFVLADENVSGLGSGLRFLAELRTFYPNIPRALLAESGRLGALSQLVEQTGISFLLAKPLETRALREALRNILLGERGFGGWSQIEPQHNPMRAAQSEALPKKPGPGARPVADFQREMILRGLLAGLNSVEFEDQLFPLLDAELAEAFQIQRWLCVDEQDGAVNRIRGTRRVEDDAQGGLASVEEQALLREAQTFEGVRPIVGSEGRSLAAASGLVCLGFVLEEAGSRALTCLVWCDATRSNDLMEMLRDLRRGLNLTLRRIRDAERRAESARQLAARVSEELRTPVGALTHALDRMRGEAMQAGMSTESLDRVLSESERVFQAVGHLKDEMLVDRPGKAPTASTASR